MYDIKAEGIAALRSVIKDGKVMLTILILIIRVLFAYLFFFV